MSGRGECKMKIANLKFKIGGKRVRLAREPKRKSTMDLFEFLGDELETELRSFKEVDGVVRDRDAIERVGCLVNLLGMLPKEGLERRARG